MGFSRKEYQFLNELGLRPRNPGCFVDGGWRGSGPVVSSHNPANNQVFVFGFDFYIKILFVVFYVLRSSLPNCVIDMGWDDEWGGKWVMLVWRQ